MSRIVKTKFYCKGTSRSAPRGSGFNNIHWVDNFIEGKWYDGEYELWYDEDEVSERNQKMFRINNKWKNYKVVDDRGNFKEIPKSHMNIIFEMGLIRLRDEKINEILKK
jgi:hypothetical protein